MLDDLLQLLFAELVQELFIEYRHVLLLHELVKALRLFWMRDGVELFFLDTLALARSLLVHLC